MIKVKKNILGEVRMSAFECEFTMEPSLPGFEKFSTINGNVFYDEANQILIAQDGCMVLLFEERTKLFYNYSIVGKYEKTFLSTVKVVGSQLELLLNTIGKESKIYLNISPIDPKFQQGVGDVNAKGLFPSARVI
jgi:hypothetical protein